MAADRGNSCLMRCQYSGKLCLRDALVPSIKQLVGGLQVLSLLHLILLDRVNGKLIEFVIVESVVVTDHPVGCVIQGKVKLG